MEAYGDSPEEAKKNIRRSDEARAAYYHNISEQAWGDRRHYELLLDSSVGVKASADILCNYLKNSNNL